MNISAFILLFGIIFTLMALHRKEVYRKTYLSMKFFINSLPKKAVIPFLLIQTCIIILAFSFTGFQLSGNLIYHQKAEVIHKSYFSGIPINPLPQASIILLVRNSNDYEWYDPIQQDLDLQFPFFPKDLTEIFSDGEKVYFSGILLGSAMNINYGKPMRHIRLTYISSINFPSFIEFIIFFWILSIIGLIFFINKLKRN